MSFSSKSALLVSSVVVAGACTTILGNDFTIGTSSAGGNAQGGEAAGGDASGGTGGAGAAGGMGGGGGGVVYPPMSCLWKAGSVRGFFDYGDEGSTEVGDRIRVVSAGGNRMRAVLEWSSPAAGPQLDVWTVDDNSAHRAPYPGFTAFDTRRLSDARAVVLIGTRDGNGGHAAEALVFDDSDNLGNAATSHPIHSAIYAVNRFEAAFDVASESPLSLVVVSTVEPQNQGMDIQTGLYRWQGTTLAVNDFTSGAQSAFDAKDFEPNSVLALQNGDAHVILGSFEESDVARQFFVPQNPPAVVTATRQIDFSLLDVSRRSDGTLLAHSIAYDMVTGAVAIKSGVLPEGELASFGEADLVDHGEVGTQQSLPSEGNFSFNEDGIVVLGRRENNPGEVAVLIVHKDGGIRFNDTVPWEDAGILPPNAVIKSAAGVVDDPALFDSIGGDIRVFAVLSAGGVDHLFTGEMLCSP